ncbi:tetratricopeptide repeat protein [Microbacteriaceae bacterium K1510]|nr:tetratricopeptide repeat protein [Microbacteriaceae bacterium K1510]
MTRQLASPDSVIEPCTDFFNDSALTDAQRAEALLVRGRAFHRTKRLEQAAADYQAAAALTPDNPEIWMFWANIEIRRRDGRSTQMRLHGTLTTCAVDVDLRHLLGRRVVEHALLSPQQHVR